MITISSPMQQENIKELLSGYNDGDVAFIFSRKEGIKLFFEVTGDSAEAAKKAKELIKSTTWGQVLYFQAQAV
ncbi:MAG: hypothetical protein LBT06_18975 [Hungatella sp.]|jgi:hypothetical protein|nr:hypothetical protein [Hungatella sp.]